MRITPTALALPLAVMLAGCWDPSPDKDGERVTTVTVEKVNPGGPEPIPCFVMAHDAGPATRDMYGTCDREDPMTVPIGTLKSTMPSRHPLYAYVLASRLYKEGQRDEAVFWYYVGELRELTRLQCYPDIPASGERALYTTLTETVGRTINQYAKSDTDKFIATINRALEWDEDNPNIYDSYTGCNAARANQRASVDKLIAGIRALPPARTDIGGPVPHVAPTYLPKDEPSGAEKLGVKIPPSPLRN